MISSLNLESVVGLKITCLTIKQNIFNVSSQNLSILNFNAQQNVNSLILVTSVLMDFKN